MGQDPNGDLHEFIIKNELLNEFENSSCIRTTIFLMHDFRKR